MSVNYTNYVRALPLEPNTVLTAENEPLNSAITQPVTVGVNVAQPAVIATRDMSYVIGCIKSGFVEGKDIRPIILTIRNLQNTEMAKAMKTDLPYFLGSWCERRRANDQVKSARFIIFDLDHVEDVEVTKQTAIEKLPFIRNAFRSVRDGVKLIAELKNPVLKESDYRILWKYLALQVEFALQLKVDTTPDWCRACFFSFDPGLLYNSAFKPVDVVKAMQEAEMLLRIREKSMEKREKMAVLARTPVSRSVIPDLIRNPVFKESDQTQSSNEQSQGNEVKELDSRLRGNDKAQGLGTYSDDDFDKARIVVQKLSNLHIAYRDWVKIGMALYAGFGERGKELWDYFLDNPHYQDTEDDLARHWRSFASVHSINVSTLFFVGEKYGCK